MAITHPITASSEIDNIVDTYATKVINGLYLIITSTSKLAGLIGVVLISIVLLLFMPLVYLYLRHTNNVIRRKLLPVYNWINEASESELRYAHLEAERKSKQFKRILRKKKLLDKNILTMGVSSQTNLLISQIFHLEDTLRNAAYPNYENKLTDQDISELVSIFEGANID